LGPVAWFWPTRSPRPGADAARQGPGELSLGKDLLWSCAMGFLAFAVAAKTGSRWSDLPPGLHDEFSYLFQAHTFLAGQTSFPSPPLPELFDQMHVLNDGRMASRYFPATGLWMAPFLAMGNPWRGWWLAQGLLASLMFWIGREAGGSACGRLVGLLCALCPGLILFSQLLLAHHPALLGLAIMQLALPRMVRSQNRAWGLLAGSGLGFAALARPMTAVGIGLPWGLWLLGRGWRDRHELRLWPWLAAPLLAAGAGQLWYDGKITGDPWKTPYGEYTALHTPRHVYGFDNVRRGEQSSAARRIEKYDDWAENLTPRLAMKNVAYRLFSSVHCDAAPRTHSLLVRWDSAFSLCHGISAPMAAGAGDGWLCRTGSAGPRRPPSGPSLGLAGLGSGRCPELHHNPGVVVGTISGWAQPVSVRPGEAGTIPTPDRLDGDRAPRTGADPGGPE
jgi:hypothetical protein